ncbi:Alpha/Beta hydrolase protein [Pilobolus umbonatus]|nr:Alpha/Beta hydrolase protein [Pilobolus umbonatus]
MSLTTEIADDVRKLLKTRTPSKVTAHSMRTALIMPPVAARGIIKNLTRPIHDQKRFVRKFNNEHWKGHLIMSEMIRCDDDIALERMKQSDLIIFELHGGGFRVGHSTMYMKSFISWLRILKNKYGIYACIMSIDYGLAPKAKYPGPVLECLKAYNYLTGELGVSPNKIIMSGDSAGGALAFEVLIRKHVPSIILDEPDTETLPLPAGLLLSSPLVTHSTSSDSWRKYKRSDLVSKTLFNLVMKEYLNVPETKEEDIILLKVAKIREGFDRFLPKKIMVFAGRREVFYDDICEIVGQIRDEGVIDITLHTENYAHDWFLIQEILKKKDRKRLFPMYDEKFVDFAVNAIKTAQEVKVDVTPIQWELPITTVQD